MRIADVEAIPYRIPMRTPLRFASGTATVADHVLVRITTDDGVTGIADVPPRPYTYGETQYSVVAIVTGLFREALLGVDPLDRSTIQARLHRTRANNAAKGALDIAVWDVIGRSFDTPVHRLLGGYTRTLRVAHMLGFDETALVLEEAMRFVAEYGIRTFKIKVGRRPLELDIQLCHALRTALGPGVELYLDANRGWTATEAQHVLGACRDLELTYFEEPTDAGEVLGRRRLVAASPVPIVADESAATLGDAAREIQTGGATALSIKTARTGFTESHKILSYAEAVGVDVIMGNQIDSRMGSIATVTFGAAFEHSSRRAAELSNFLDIADDLAVEPLPIRDGMVAVSDLPGVGASLDESKLAAYRVDAKGRA